MRCIDLFRQGQTAEKSVCSVLDCGRPSDSKGYCSAHYQRLWKHGDPLIGGSLRTGKGELLRWVNDVALNHVGDECLPWPFGRDVDGYGHIRIDGKPTGAHRYICRIVNGEPQTPEHQAAHNCGKGHEGCVAPDHLDWKTPAQNQADRIHHGTHQRGERNTKAKLTEAAVREILALNGVETKLALAQRFGVDKTTISRIQLGRDWSWLSEAAA